MPDEAIKSVPVTKTVGYHGFTEFERGGIFGAQAMENSILEVAMQFGFSRKIIS